MADNDETETDDTAFGSTGAIHKRPLTFLLYCACGVLVGSALFALGGWITGSSHERTPLILVGLSVITVAIVLKRGGTAVTLSILIVGVLVAGEDYLLKIAHMFSGSKSDVEAYMKSYKKPAQDTEESAVAEALKRLEADGVLTPEAAKAVSLSVSEDIVENLAREVRLSESEYPLREIAAGNAREVDREYGSEEFFANHMNSLFADGLVTFPGSDFAEAEITGLGQRVITVLGGEDLHDRGSALDQGHPEPSDITPIDLAASVPGSLPAGGDVVWFKFRVASSSEHAVSASSTEGDPFVWLYGPDEFELLEEDDDDGDGLNSLVTRTLEPGEYYLAVTNIRDTDAPFTVEVTQR